MNYSSERRAKANPNKIVETKMFKILQFAGDVDRNSTASSKSRRYSGWNMRSLLGKPFGKAKPSDDAVKQPRQDDMEALPSSKYPIEQIGPPEQGPTASPDLFKYLQQRQAERNAKEAAAARLVEERKNLHRERLEKASEIKPKHPTRLQVRAITASPHIFNDLERRKSERENEKE